MTINDLIPASTVETIKRAGLHRALGVMHGVPELALKEAAQLIGAKAYMRRKEAAQITAGLAALAQVTEKTANPAVTALLSRALVPALGGAAIAAIPHYMSNDPMKGSPLVPMALGGLLGGLGGVGSAFGKAVRGPLAEQVAHAVESLPRMF